MDRQRQRRLGDQLLIWHGPVVLPQHPLDHLGLVGVVVCTGAAMTGSMSTVSRVSGIGSVKDINTLNAPPRPAFMQVKYTVYQALVRDYLD